MPGLYKFLAQFFVGFNSSNNEGWYSLFFFPCDTVNVRKIWQHCFSSCWSHYIHVWGELLLAVLVFSKFGWQYNYKLFFFYFKVILWNNNNVAISHLVESATWITLHHCALYETNFFDTPTKTFQKSLLTPFTEYRITHFTNLWQLFLS